MSRAFRASIMKRILAVALVTMAINFACVTSAPSQASKEVQHAQKVGREINKIGIVENVWVKTLDGTNLNGHINEIGDDYVVVDDCQTGNVTRLSTAHVQLVMSTSYEP